MSSSIIAEFKDVSFSYLKRGRIPFFGSTEFEVLKNISFSVERGDVLGVVGRNGAGKSTTLLLLSNMLSPTKGEVVKNYKNAALLNFNSGMMPDLSGEDNIFLQGMFLGMPRKLIESKYDRIVDLAGIGEAIKRPVRSYSTGMKSRLGFAIAFYREPELMLIDETLGVGDRDFRQKSTALMKEKITSSRGATVIVSHNKSIINDVCTKCVVIDHGELVFFGSKDEALTKYQI